MNSSVPSRRANRWIAPTFLFVITLSGLLASQRWYGYAIDEASYLWVVREEKAWIDELPSKPLAESFSDAGLKARWHFLEEPGKDRPTHSNFNLPLSMHLMTLGSMLTLGQLEERLSARLASMILFAWLIARTYRVMSDSFGPQAGWGSAILLVASPRVFGHAHLAGTETTLSCLWWLTTLALIDSSVTRMRHHILMVPLLLSWTMATKLSGWFLAPVVLVGILLLRPTGWKRMIAYCVILPWPMIVLLTPPLWHQPIRGLLDYLQHVRDNPWSIPSFFAGEVTSARLPGWTGWAIFSATSPIVTLLLGVGGVMFSWTDRRILVIGMSTLALMIARSIGLLPTHDVERHFAPALYGMAILAGWSAARLSNLLLKHSWAVILTWSILLIEPLYETWTYRAHGLCFYNQAVGGMSGARALGFETSYWWEAMTDDDWKETLRDLPSGSKVFLRPDHPGLDDLRRWGIWRSDLHSAGPEAPTYILYAKRAAYFIPSENGTSWLPTDLGLWAEQGPVDHEVRFRDVRLIGRTAKPTR
ncbi:glycosyltransferase family 39 protein [bacterium]|nr:glycosyltransferase family 39 protein [bacterium]